MHEALGSPFWELLLLFDINSDGDETGRDRGRWVIMSKLAYFNLHILEVTWGLKFLIYNLGRKKNRYSHGNSKGCPPHVLPTTLTLCCAVCGEP